jgi:hypothetical protein
MRDVLAIGRRPIRLTGGTRAINGAVVIASLHGLVESTLQDFNRREIVALDVLRRSQREYDPQTLNVPRRQQRKRGRQHDSCRAAIQAAQVV